MTINPETEQYDPVLEALSNEDGVNPTSIYHAIQVDHGEDELAVEVIEDNGGDVTSVNDHESGHTIYFLVANDFEEL